MLKDSWEDTHGLNLSAHPSCSNNKDLQPPKGLSDNDHLSASSSKINATSLTTALQDGQSLVDSNMQELIKFLSTNYGPMKTPLEIGTPEYSKLVEILRQSSVNGRESSVDKGANSIQNVETASLTEDKSSTARNSQAKVSYSEKTTEQLWEGSLQLSSSVTLSAVAFFKSGEKLVGKNWPEFIEVKGKVRLEAFEKYVQDLPRSRNRGLMVTSICWNEASSNIGLNGMKEVAKGYKKSSRVGFAQLLSGIDLYICPRSDPIITILAKYGFFKGMSVIDDRPGSMIGCVVWRKNRPVNPAGSALEGKNSLDLTENQNSPPGFTSKQPPEKMQSSQPSQRDERLTLPLTLQLTETQNSPLGFSSRPPYEKMQSSQRDECLTLPLTLQLTETQNSPLGFSSRQLYEKMQSSQRDEYLTLQLTETQNSPLGFSSKQPPEKMQSSQPSQHDERLNLPSTAACADVDGTEGSSSSSSPCNLVLKKRPFEDDDLPEFDFGVSCQKSKSTLQSQRINSPKKLDNSGLTQLPTVVKKTKLFDEDDMPEWRPPELHNPPLPPLPRPPGLPPPRPDTCSSYSTYLPFHSPVSSQPPPQQLPPPPPRPPVNSQSPRFLRPPLQQLPPPPPRPPVSSKPPGFLRPPQQQLQPTPPRFPRPPPQQLPPPPQQLLPPPPPPAGMFNSNQPLWRQPSYPFSQARRPQL